MAVYSATFSPEPGRCACGYLLLPHVRAVLDEEPVCESCLEASDWHDTVGDFLDALDTLGMAIAEAHPTNRGWLIADAQRILRKIGQHSVPAGHDEPLPDDVFAEAVVERAAAAGEPPELTMETLRKLAPEVPVEQCAEIARKSRDRAIAASARAAADVTEAEVFVTLFDRARDAQSLGEVVDRLGIDLERFTGAALAAAAAAGTPVLALPAATVDELLAASQRDGAK